MTYIPNKHLSVSELNNSIKKILERSISRVRVLGEISQLKTHSSGHVYLTLKDKMPHTVFVNANPDWVTGHTQYYDMAVNEGDMVIVPSHVGHFTPHNLSKQVKKIVAFDLNVIADTQ